MRKLTILLCALALVAVASVRRGNVTNLFFRTPIFYVNAVTGNDNNTGTASDPWQTLGKAASYTRYPLDAMIDGMGQVYYERFVCPTNNLTIRNMTLDGTVTFSNAWGQVSGEFYSNSVALCPIQMFQDGVRLTPRVCTNEADVVANLAQGEFSWISGLLYYRATDGAAPATHTLRLTSRAYDSVSGLLYLNGVSRITLNNVHVRNLGTRNPRPYSLWINNCANIILVNCSATNCAGGPAIENCVNITADANFNVVSNYDVGLRIGGVEYVSGVTNLTMQGLFKANGFEPWYIGTAFQSDGDKDGIGIGGLGGLFSGIVFTNCTVISNGFPITETTVGGSGIFVGTSYGITVYSLSILNCYVKDNYNYGLFVDGETLSKTITGNIFQRNAGTPVSSKQNVRIGHRTGDTSLTFDQNLIADSKGTNNNAALRLYIDESGGTVTVRSNAFFNNGATVAGYNSDLWLGTANMTALTETYNTFYRSNSWGVTKVGKVANGTAYDLTHMTGTGAGFWRTDTGLGANDATSTTGPLVNPATPTYVP